VKKHVYHHNVGHHRQHQGRAQQRALAEQQQRAAAKLEQSQNQRIGMGMGVIEPGKLIAAERANRRSAISGGSVNCLPSILLAAYVKSRNAET
jgi:hypothetical protein